MTVIHPVQLNFRLRNERSGHAPAKVTEKGYEVYSHLYGNKQTLQRLNERGGFGTGELVAFLYAHSFPRDEWSKRVDEALEGLVI